MSSRCIARRRAASATRSRRSPRSSTRLRPPPAGRRDERLRGAAARRPRGRVRRGRGLLQQVHPGRAGPRLRDLPQGGAGRDQGQRHDAGARPPRPARGASSKTGQYRFTPPIHVIVAFHQALEEFCAEGGVAGPRRALRRQRPHPDRRHARRSASRRCCRTLAGADHRHVPHAERSEASSSSASTTR